eukprot:292363_1
MPMINYIPFGKHINAATGARALCRIYTEKISHTRHSTSGIEINFAISKRAVNHIILMHWFRPLAYMFVDIVYAINYQLDNIRIEEQILSTNYRTGFVCNHGNSIVHQKCNKKLFSAFGYQVVLPGYEYYWTLEVYLFRID